jgi:putative tricarboxylic transport membrane protein
MKSSDIFSRSVHGLLFAVMTTSAISCLTLALASDPSLAQGKAPKGPVEVTVGSGPGGSPDVIMRNVLKIMNEEKIITIPAAVQNRPGGSGAVAYNHVLGKPGDENLLFTINQPMFTTPIMQGTPSVIDQVVPIAAFIQSELVFLVQPNAPYKSMKEFIEAAKASPGRVRISGAQAGGTDNIATALIEKAGGVKLTYVPFDSGSAALAAFLGGNVEGTFATLEEGLPVFQGGKARPLAILSEKRRSEAAYKDVPTAKEQGYEVLFGQEWGVALPPKTDPEIAKWWEDKFRKVVETKTWKDGLEAKFQRTDFIGLDRIKAHNAKTQDMYRAIMTDLGLAKK